jgi:hypothetical protein
MTLIAGCTGGVLLATVLITSCSGGMAVAPMPTRTPSPTPTPTIPPTTSGESQFVSADGSYGFDYPGAWTAVNAPASQGTTANIFTNQATGEVVVVVEYSPAMPSTSLATYVSTLASTLAQTFGATNESASPQTGTAMIGAITWTTISGAMTLNGTPYKVLGYALNHDASTYSVITLASAATLSRDNTADFQPLLTSFTFLK